VCGSVPIYRRAPSRNLRLDPDVYREPGRSIFVTVRATVGRAPFRRAALNDEVVRSLCEERDRGGCDVYAFCLMPDHLHVVAAPRSTSASVLRFVDRFKSVSTRVAWRHGETGRLWQPRFHDHVVRVEEALLAICDYVVMNPVRAGLVAQPDDYRWGGLLDPVPL
jgi:REP-associated tyrosine transposase